MRLSSYVDEDGATVRATEREEEVFAGDPLSPPGSLLLRIPHSAFSIQQQPPPPPLLPPSHRQTAPDGAMCIFTDGPIRPLRRLRIVGLSRREEPLFAILSRFFLFFFFPPRGVCVFGSFSYLIFIYEL